MECKNIFAGVILLTALLSTSSVLAAEQPPNQNWIERFLNERPALERFAKTSAPAIIVIIQQRMLAALLPKYLNVSAVIETVGWCGLCASGVIAFILECSLVRRRLLYGPLGPEWGTIVKRLKQSIETRVIPSIAIIMTGKYGSVIEKAAWCWLFVSFFDALNFRQLIAMQRLIDPLIHGGERRQRALAGWLNRLRDPFARWLGRVT